MRYLEDYDALIDIALDSRDFEWVKELQERREAFEKGDAVEDGYDPFGAEKDIEEQLKAKLIELSSKEYDSLVDFLDSIEEELVDAEAKLLEGLFREMIDEEGNLTDSVIDLDGIEFGIATISIKEVIDSFLEKGKKGQTLAEYMDDFFDGFNI